MKSTQAKPTRRARAQSEAANDDAPARPTTDGSVEETWDKRFRERFITCSAGRLFGVEAGEVGAPPVLLIHGYPDTHDVWLPVMRRLARAHHVFAYDVRGAGASCRPRDVADYQMANLADDIEAVASAVFGDRAYHLVGHDWGGIQSWEAVSRADASSNLASFMSLSGPCLDHVAIWMRADIGATASRRHAVLRQLLGSSAYIPALLTPMMPTLLWRFILADRWRREHESNAGTRFQTLERDGAVGANLYRANVVRALRHPRDVTSKIPTRLVGLGRDPYVGVATMRASLNHLAAGTYEELDEDHWSVFRRPEMLSRVISDWVAEHDSTRLAHANT